ncbi:hypothetical protein [Klenkia taihuensis]|uniref:hypothetical protein n=1 Tax=Klenkia taihuensis TaxID=1225127 RepID=UPI0010424F9A|nr:hypothetical protein [Klenkia taihuensis]
MTDRPRPRGGPLLGWLLVVAAAAASALLTGDTTWASGALDGGGRVDATQADLLRLDGYQATVVPAFAGMVAAALVGLVAVPWSRPGRWAVTALVVGLVVAGVVVTLAVDVGATPEEQVGGAVVGVVPAALLLVLVWLRLRRGCAWVALLFAVVGLVAHVVTVVRLLGSAGTPAWGAWAMLLLELVAVTGAALAVRTTPPRDRVSPVRPG